MTKAEGLLHGDLHTGSIFITEDDMRVLIQNCFLWSLWI